MARRKFIILLSALLLLGVVIVLCVGGEKQMEEPAYGGQKLSYWVRRLQDPAVQRDPENGKALRAIGAKGIPCYLHWMAYEPGRMRKLWNSIGKKGRAWFGWNWQDPQKTLKFGAYTAATLLSEQAEEAIPQLLPYLTNSDQPSLAKAAMFCITDMGPAARPILLSTMTNTQQSSRLRVSAALCLARQGSNQVVAAQLEQMLQDSDQFIRNGAAEALRWMATRKGVRRE